ncbi:ImmA/IrrE family metallo-endopeptidase [Pseudomonas asiatica]|uniref:ImmA/IrrE family metallo-endopeptidase n=1 Tax=Pseudomonas asiatica TaxID=2219225 RepID=UPI0018A8B064|nr:ImmA/IrrE family metallo-endopeptidase [Pseudomonas asiatica]MBF8802143.1 ImmA/IrrE family metallo-endopeptidase [Pseudomonas asiatica]
MSDVPNGYPEDFEVYPSSMAAAEDFTAALASLRQALKPADAKVHARPGESYEDFLIRLALNASSTNAVLYRKNDSAEETKIQAWLSMISERSKFEVLSRAIPRFQGLSQEQLREIALISMEPYRVSSLTEHLAAAYGVLLVVEPGFKAMKMDGCTFKLAQGTPVIGITIRYNRYDNFWFTLMHELAHISLHYHQLDQAILDDFDENVDSDIETEANIIAKKSLVSTENWRHIWNARTDKRQFLMYCERANMHPAIAAGMLRHQAKDYKLYPELTQAINLREVFGFTDD